MNQDFSLPATPGLARKLMKLAEFCRIELDPSIEEMAQRDLLPEEAFDGYGLSPEEKLAIQSIFDFGFRCVVPSPQSRSNMIALTATQIAGIEPVVVYTRQAMQWNAFAKRKGYVPGQNFHAFMTGSRDVLDADFIKANRHGVLLIDEPGIGMKGTFTEILAMDFARTLVLCSRRNVADMMTATMQIAPNGPIDVINNQNYFARRDAEQSGFRSQKPEDLAVLLNIVTDALPPNEADPDFEAAMERIAANIAKGNIDPMGEWEDAF